MIMKRLIVLLFVSVLFSSFTLKTQDGHDVIAIYEKIDLDYGTLDDDGEPISFVLVKTQIDKGEYKVEIGDKLNSYVYNLRGTDFYIKFRYSPYLYTFDEGILVWSGYGSGTFYKVD